MLINMAKDPALLTSGNESINQFEGSTSSPQEMNQFEN
jgi:hypothetical protein